MSAPFKMKGWSPFTKDEEEKVKDTITGTKEDPIWTKSKGGKSSSYKPDATYAKKSGGKGTRWVNPEGGSFITANPS